MGEVIYGSTSFDIGVGYERLSSNGPDTDRRYISLGVRGKTGVLGWSAEAHYGRIGGDDEISAALGAQYDIARGLSANLGLNHARAKADAGTFRIVDTRVTKGSFRSDTAFRVSSGLVGTVFPAAVPPCDGTTAGSPIARLR